MANWDPFLARYPDQVYAVFLRRGFLSGFRIGFNPTQKLRRARSNLESVKTYQIPIVVSDYIAAEVAAGKLRLVHPSEAHLAHVSPIDIIPKLHQVGKYRLIVDLSSPANFSVNDGISPEIICSLSYTSVDQAASIVRACGKGAWMAKLDLKSAYRMVPTHPLDQFMLGIEWKASTYVDCALPFGLRSAPLLFTAIADGLS